MPQKLLVFTKDTSVAALLSDGLEKRGITVLATASKKKLLAWASTVRADFVLVDASASTEGGLEFCRRLRQCDDYARIIMVTSSHRRLTSEEIDSCMAAPVTLRKVQYRLNALRNAEPRNQLHVGDISLDPKNRIVRRGELESKLTPKETLLLQLLMQRAGKLVSRKEIMSYVWDTNYMGDTRTIDVHIRWLRKKIEPAPSDPIYIRTVRRQGYLFEILPSGEQVPLAEEPRSLFQQGCMEG